LEDGAQGRERPASKVFGELRRKHAIPR
jgi:hypothetical protein